MAQFHSKVTAGALAGALTVILTAEAERRGYPISGTEGASITLVFMTLLGWFMPSDDGGNDAENAAG